MRRFCAQLTIVTDARLRRISTISVCASWTASGLWKINIQLSQHGSTMNVLNTKTCYCLSGLLCGDFSPFARG
jgi:hypothetical protein